MSKNKRRPNVNKATLLYNKEREVFNSQIIFADLEDGEQLRKDIAYIQEHYLLNNRELLEQSIRLFVEEKKELIRIASGKAQIKGM